MIRWGDLEAAAPELARLGRERIEAIGLVLLGTLRADGSPRISPVEPFLVAGQLLFGAMSRSAKAADLDRDARCAVHSVVTAPNAGEGELKLYAHAKEVSGSALRDAPAGAWWIGRPVADARVFAVQIESAVFVRWDLAGGLMTVYGWSPQRGATVATRTYP